jgi:hypothetical protein
VRPGIEDTGRCVEASRLLSHLRTAQSLRGDLLEVRSAERSRSTAASGASCGGGGAGGFSESIEAVGEADSKTVA